MNSTLLVVSYHKLQGLRGTLDVLLDIKRAYDSEGEKCPDEIKEEIIGVWKHIQLIKRMAGF